MVKAWCRFFRVQNLLTVPGDVLAGAAVGGGLGKNAIYAALASVFLYMFGLADNDIVGAKTDPKDRPLVSGEITMAQAVLARGGCLFAALILATAMNLPPYWFITAFLLALMIVIYNRTKVPLLMGLCRGLNVLCGGATAWMAAAVWTLYITFVTKYSERETIDPTNGRKVAMMVYALIGLQMVVIAGALILK